VALTAAMEETKMDSVKTVDAGGGARGGSPSTPPKRREEWGEEAKTRAAPTSGAKKRRGPRGGDKTGSVEYVYEMDERGDAMFGCEKCEYDPEGCESCLGGPPVRSECLWNDAHFHDVPPVKTYRPTEEEWNGDPLEYIASIREEAEKYGVCNIIPPESWKPDFCLPGKEKLRFRTRIQALNELQNRPAGPSARAREKMREEEKSGVKSTASTATGGRMGSVGRMGGASQADANAIAEKYGFQQGQRHNLATLERYSDYFKKKYFSRDGKTVDASIKDMEGEFWRLIEDNKGRSVEVIYGADIATMEVGSGFAKKGSESCPPNQERYATSPWNVCNMPYNSESCLSHVEATTGITVPWLYFGMTMSAFCWHVEDHNFYSVNYHHFGAPKVWYSIPATHSKQFEEVMRRRLPHLFQSQPDLLHSLVTILSPKVLQDEGIPVYRAEQHPRSYIITFPFAYHAGFNTGFNCAEAVNFAPIDWLPYGVGATERYMHDKRYQSVAHDQLLSTLTESVHKHPKFSPVLAEVVGRRVKEEEERRADASSFVANTVRMENTPEAPDFNERDCTTCLGDLNWACVTCSCTFAKGRGYAYCLRCVKACDCSRDNRTLFYRNTIEELQAKVTTLRELRDSNKLDENNS
jgi:histone demethylase JARID1